MSIKTLDPKYCYEIDEVWPHRHPGSDKYFEAMLKSGYGIGLIDNNDNELVGWIFTNLRGDLHSLHVKDVPIHISLFSFNYEGVDEIVLFIIDFRNTDVEELENY